MKHLLTLTGILIFAIAWLWSLFPPGKINSLYGYRTRKSMSSQENWDLAQSFASRQMMFSGLVLLVLGFFLAFTGFSDDTKAWLAVALLLLSMARLVWVTERRLGNRE